jgi:predicted ester cyclase
MHHWYQRIAGNWIFSGIAFRAKLGGMQTSDYEHFLRWAFGFEAAFWTDDFTPLRSLLAENAGRVAHSEGSLAANDAGADAMLGGLRRSVHELDRRFDVRIPEIVAGPETRPDGIWMRYALRLRRAGLPELVIEGEHLTRYVDGRIVAIEETLPPGTGERADAFLREHAARLRPAGSPPSAPTDPRDARDADAALLRALARGYAGAKSEQDIAAALSLCHEDFVLDAVPLGVPAADRKQAEAQLQLFFHAFPDFRVDAEGMTAGNGTVCCWGHAEQTFRGSYLGFEPTGRPARHPFVSLFEARDGKLVRERYYFDLAQLCTQIGLPVAEVGERLGALRRTR